MKTIIELEKENEKLKEALIWCSGSEDFQEEGKAREGWLKICKPLLDNKREKLRLLLEGENGFFREYTREIQYGSIHSLGKVLNKSIDEIFNLFEEEK